MSECASANFYAKFVLLILWKWGQVRSNCFEFESPFSISSFSFEVFVLSWLHGSSAA